MNRPFRVAPPTDAMACIVRFRPLVGRHLPGLRLLLEDRGTRELVYAGRRSLPETDAAVQDWIAGSSKLSYVLSGTGHDVPLAAARIDGNEISYLVAREVRGLGLGTYLVNRTLQAVDAARCRRLIAHVVRENIASRRLLERARFDFDKALSTPAHGSRILKYVRVDDRFNQDPSASEATFC